MSNAAERGPCRLVKRRGKELFVQRVQVSVTCHPSCPRMQETMPSTTETSIYIYILHIQMQNLCRYLVIWCPAGRQCRYHHSARSPAKNLSTRSCMQATMCFKRIRIHCVGGAFQIFLLLWPIARVPVKAQSAQKLLPKDCLPAAPAGQLRPRWAKNCSLKTACRPRRRPS